MKRLKSYLKGIFFLILVILIAEPSVAQLKDQKTSGQIQQLLSSTEHNLNDSRDMILADDYARSKKNGRSALQNIERLKEIFLPLPNRLKRILKNEKLILKNTAQLNPSGDQFEKNIGKVREGQQANNKQLGIALNQSRELEKLAKQNGNKGLTGKSGISPVLNKALEYQLRAEVELERKNLPEAKKAQEKSIVLLEKLLKQQKNKTQQNNKSKNKSEDNQKDSSNNAQKNQTSSPKKNKTSENGKEQEKGQKNKQYGTSDKNGKHKQLPVAKEKKVTGKQALKELMRLQQKYEKERKAREEKYGVIRQGRVNVEKDW